MPAAETLVSNDGTWSVVARSHFEVCKVVAVPGLLSLQPRRKGQTPTVNKSRGEIRAEVLQHHPFAHQEMRRKDSVVLVVYGALHSLYLFSQGYALRSHPGPLDP